ncbi:MAG: hypothetical protein RSE93_00385 [Oscillospiraceae bacterium]
MKRQYNDLISTVDIKEASEKSKRILKAYMILRIIFFAIMILLILTEYLLKQLKSPYKNIVSDITFLWTNVYLIFIIVSMTNLNKFFYKCCDVDNAIFVYSYFVKFHYRKRIIANCFYNISLNFVYAGRFDDVKKMKALFDKYCFNNKATFKYELVCAEMAFQKGDLEDLEFHCNNLNSMYYIVKPKKALATLYKEKLSYIQILQAEKNGAYLYLYNGINSCIYSANSMAKKVFYNYQLYRFAKAMGDEYMAKGHRDFVLNYGGTLVYKKIISDYENGVIKSLLPVNYA